MLRWPGFFAAAEGEPCSSRLAVPTIRASLTRNGECACQAFLRFDPDRQRVCARAGNKMSPCVRCMSATPPSSPVSDHVEGCDHGLERVVMVAGHVSACASTPSDWPRHSRVPVASYAAIPRRSSSRPSSNAPCSTRAHPRTIRERATRPTTVVVGKCDRTLGVILCRASLAAELVQ